jgi:hypothetical protein
VLKATPEALFSSLSLPLEPEPALSVSSLAFSLLAVQLKVPWMSPLLFFFFSSSHDFSISAVLETSKAPSTLSSEGNSTLRNPS